MNRYIDIHCHILPGIDDGAHSLEESVAMAKKAVADGVRSNRRRAAPRRDTRPHPYTRHPAMRNPYIASTSSRRATSATPPTDTTKEMPCHTATRNG